MWEHDENKLALLELYVTGNLRQRAGQKEAWAELNGLRWTRRTSRRGWLELVPEHKPTVQNLLDRIWPGWQQEWQALTDAGLNPTPEDWRRWQDQLRAGQVGELPGRLNRRTALSTVAPHSKANLNQARRQALGDTTVTSDGIIRLRPPAGLYLLRGGVVFDAVTIASVLGEVAVTERALLDGTLIAGPVRAILSVENLGPYQDIEQPEGWLIVHVPGWDTAMLRLLLRLFQNTPVIHFGDLDPAGIRIYRHLRQMHPNLKWAVPDFWEEYISHRALPGTWPDYLDLADAPPLVNELASRSLWLEQEAIILDSRLKAALEGMILSNLAE